MRQLANYINEKLDDGRALIVLGDALLCRLPTGPSIGLLVGTESERVIASPIGLMGVVRVAEAVWHDIQETGCVALDAPFVVGVDGA